MGDTIDRQAAIDAVEFGITYAKAFDVNTGESKELFKEGNNALKKAVERIKALPPSRKEGKWIYEVQDRLVDETDDGRVYRKEKRWKCSECGYDKGFLLYKPKDKFCIECGADMRGEENE